MNNVPDLVHPEVGKPPFRYDPWEWCEPSHGEHFRRCSFCGSIHPDDLAAESVWLVVWADRKYGWPHKFYINIPNRNPETLFAVGSTNRFTEYDRTRGYVPFEELTDEQHAIINRGSWHIGPGEGVYFSTRPNHFGKFYTVHLADPNIDKDVKRKIELRSGLHFEFHDGQVSWKKCQLETNTL